ncbi:GPI transamidase component PIG-S isoform X2 [Orussus abietinus]|uniref:GPI transamidase component PIG-S isoform X2 n=1 Tax=Orussus abietinus TaxID=222816 RepID=UPI000626C0EC|nr:GPI transamidase component PIG-S isoform X2 [Orussus abietinus]
MAEEPDVIGYDTPTDEKYRVYASISFAFLLLGIGVPLWWYTTSVPRVPLPYSGIEGLSDLEMKIKTKILIAVVDKRRAETLTEEIRKNFEKAELFNLEVVYEVISNNLVPAGTTMNDLKWISETFDIEKGELLLLEVRSMEKRVLVGSRRSIYFSSEANSTHLCEVLSQWILQDKSLALTKNALTKPTEYSLDTENRRRFPPSPAYDILLTVVNPDPEKLNIEWNLQNIAEEYIEPFVNELSLVGNFSVKSQWLYLVQLGVIPKEVPDSSPLGRHYALTENVLPLVITPLEKKLASQVSLHPCINLVMYMVPCEEAPLYIYTRKGQRSMMGSNAEAFLSPRWGGVVIANPLSTACEGKEGNKIVSVNPDESSIMGVFHVQLRLLLGLQDLHPISGVTVTPPPNLKPRDWELDGLLRIRSVEQLTSAKLTLQSLAQLLGEISNIVITDTVGDRIKRALDCVTRSADLLKKGRLEEGFLLSKEAFVAAEKAFSDSSLLALLYFPEDQKSPPWISDTPCTFRCSCRC